MAAPGGQERRAAARPEQRKKKKKTGAPGLGRAPHPKPRPPAAAGPGVARRRPPVELTHPAWRRRAAGSWSFLLGGKRGGGGEKKEKKNASTHGAITPAPTRRMLAHSLQRPTPVTPRTPATPRACVCACVPSQRMRSSTLRCARTAALARSSAAAARPGTAALGPTRQTTPHLAGVARPSLAAAAPAVRAMASASPAPPGLKPYLCVLKCDRRKGGRPCLTLTHPTHPSPLPFFFLSPPQTKNKTGPPPTRPPWTPT